MSTLTENTKITLGIAAVVMMLIIGATYNVVWKFGEVLNAIEKCNEQISEVRKISIRSEDRSWTVYDMDSYSTEFRHDNAALKVPDPINSFRRNRIVSVARSPKDVSLE